MLLGIMGKIGSGKSTCTIYLKDSGFYVYDCDSIAKELIGSGKTSYVMGDPIEFFTDESLQELCRNTLHKDVFKYIFDDYSGKIKEKNYNAVIETALPNDEFLRFCDKTILIYNSLDNKYKILNDNRDYTIGKTKLIFDSQKYYERYYDKADFKIENNGTASELIEKLKEVMNEICVICK